MIEDRYGMDWRIRVFDHLIELEKESPSPNMSSRTKGRGRPKTKLRVGMHSRNEKLLKGTIEKLRKKSEIGGDESKALFRYANDDSLRPTYLELRAIFAGSSPSQTDDSIFNDDKIRQYMAKKSTDYGKRVLKKEAVDNFGRAKSNLRMKGLIRVRQKLCVLELISAIQSRPILPPMLSITPAYLADVTVQSYLLKLKSGRLQEGTNGGKNTRLLEELITGIKSNPNKFKESLFRKSSRLAYIYEVLTSGITELRALPSPAKERRLVENRVRSLLDAKNTLDLSGVWSNAPRDTPIEISLRLMQAAGLISGSRHFRDSLETMRTEIFQQMSLSSLEERILEEREVPDHELLSQDLLAGLNGLSISSLTHPIQSGRILPPGDH